jgi:glutamine synthetase
VDSDAPALPVTLDLAVSALRASERAKEILGEPFVDHYLRTRDWEARQHHRSVSEWELRRYFEAV